MNKLYVVGIGPGKKTGMTLEAINAINSCNVIVGFTTYINLISDDFPEKEFIATGMGKEKERCQMALKLADEGKKVAMICSGDASVYGMAGLIYELKAEGEYNNVEIKTIAGVTAALSASALLGAAAGHDFACVSLSDYMISWEKICERLTLLAKADMVIALYNTRSHKRPDSLRKACEILLNVLPDSTSCGVAKNIGRDEESFKTMTLLSLKDYEADMFTTVFIGNSSSKIIDGKLITPRGYLNV